MAQPKKETSEQKQSNEMSIDSLFQEYEKRIRHFESQVDDFPTDGNRITSDRWKGAREDIKFHMQQTYPLVHGGVIALAYNFLTIKKKYGSKVEKALYENMTMVKFFDRLATKRAVVFFKASDSYTLRDGRGGYANWESVGTDQESQPKLEDYLSYDELIISAMCGISSPTHFVNNGDRRNCGRINEMTWNLDPRKGIYPQQGVYMGLVGARFERSNVMENSLMAIDQRQNKPENGYGSYDANNNDDNKQQDDQKNNCVFTLEQELSEDALLQRAQISEDKLKKKNKVIRRAFEQFYDRRYLPTFEEIKAGFAQKDATIKKRYLERESWSSSDYFDMEIFRQRIRVSLEIFLFDADRRATLYQQKYGNQLDKSKKMGAFCHIVGLGTGVWAFEKEEQNREIVKVTKDIIEKTNLKNIDCVYFSWLTSKCMYEDDTGKEPIFKQQSNEDYKVKDKKGHEITVQFGQRAPADDLEDPFRQCLITAMYAWDSNSFPGNEYYKGMLSASGDPAAAACSTIPFVQNSEINKEYITGENTGVYFFDPEKNEYEFKKLGDIDFEKNKKAVLKQSVMSIPYKRERLMKK